MSVARQVLCRLCAGVRSPGVVTSRALASTPSLGDKVTHTGQQWDEADPRNARFSVTGLEKQVNNQWAIDLIAKVPPKEVNTRIVSLPQRVPSFKTLNTIYSVKKSSFFSARLPVTEVAVLSVIPRCTSTWMTGHPRAASTVASDSCSNQTIRPRHEEHLVKRIFILLDSRVYKYTIVLSNEENKIKIKPEKSVLGSWH